jgi:DNA helicase-2/ATP-dependent DNA helicase PcrA
MTVTPTPEQMEIIEYPALPLRVAASAGTGKTTTLAMRIARLIEAESVEPHEVLGITFTNKAAHELSERIATLATVELDPANDVEVHTYHGFAAHLLSEFGALVGAEHDAKVITPTFSRQLLFDAIAAGEYQTVDVTWRGIVALPLKLAADLGDNLAVPNDLVDLAPNDPDEVWAQRLELVTILQRYERDKRRLGVLDYADLIRLATELVTTHTDVARRVRSRYRMVLLDEYQDTNPAQRHMLQEIFGRGFPITAVGDPDQTIYEWRGASLQNFAQFPGHFPNADGSPSHTHTLTLNRRSDRRILELANAIRRNIEDDPQRDLRSLPEAEPGFIGTHWARTAREEAEFVAETMHRLHDAGIAWKDMAVLFRKNKDMVLVHQALEEHGIPTEVASLGGLLTIPEVADVHAWLRILEDPADGPALMRILLGSRYRLGLADIRPLTEWARAADGSDDELALPRRSLVEAIDAIDPGTEERVASSFSHFRRTYRRLLQDAQGVSLVELVRKILQMTGAWQEVEAMPDATRLSARLNLYRFLDLAEEWSPLEGRSSLPAFLDHLAMMEEEQAEELDTARLSGEDAVVLLTVHRAKGLEWPVVFLPAVFHNNFPSQVRLYEDPHTKAQFLPYALRLDRESLPPLDALPDYEDRKALLRQRSDLQEWRIAYVAVTRAQHRLYVSGAFWYGSPAPRTRPVRPSALFQLASDHGEDLGTADDPGERPLTLRYESETGPGPDPVFPEGWDAALRRAAVDPQWPSQRAAELGVSGSYDAAMTELQQMLFRLPEPPAPPSDDRRVTTSVTGLVTYATCPRRFYWSEVDRLPRRPSKAAQRGIDVHRRIELHNRGTISFEDLEPDTYDLAPSGDAAAAADPFGTFLTSRFASMAPILIEAPFDLYLGEAVVRGRIDAVYEPAPGSWEIVDFKSGRASGNEAHRVQLQAYAVAAKEVPFTTSPPDTIRVLFAYLGGGLKEVGETVDDAWLEAAGRRLGSLVDGIAAERWDPAPSDACGRCDFQRFCEPGRAFLEEWS